MYCYKCGVEITPKSGVVAWAVPNMTPPEGAQLAPLYWCQFNTKHKCYYNIEVLLQQHLECYF